MSHEIIYTSAPQGLKPGSKGFCTVVATAGIPKNLLERLESLSGYHHAFMTQEVGGLQNPVNFAHYRLTLGGRRYDVLSRVCDAGPDYTQRTNKLAHHVALEAAEATAAVGGPAWVLASPGFCVEQWDGRVQTLPNGRRPPLQDCPRGVCRAWEQLTGDAGWAGVLAESAFQTERTMSVIFRPGLDALPLLVEALCLLPPEKRWELTFSTYYCKTQGGVDCHWRFVLDDTSEATALRRDPQARCLDLSKPLGPASGGELVTLARTGLAAQCGEAKRAGPAQRLPPGRPRPSGSEMVGPPPPPVETPDEIRLAAPDLPASDTVHGLQLASPLRRGHRDRPSASGRGWKATLAMLLVGVGFASGFMVGRLTGPATIVAQNDLREPTGGSEPASGEAGVTGRHPPATDQTKPLPSDLPEAGLTADNPSSEDEKTPPTTTPETPPPVVPEPMAKAPEKPRDPFADIRQRQNRLELPPSTSQGAEAGLPNTKPEQLAKLDVVDVKSCELSVEGAEFQPRGGRKHAIEIMDSDAERSWNLVTIREASDTKSDWAVFRLKDSTLSFEWKHETPVRLQFCELVITVDGKTERCSLNRVEKIKPPQIDFASPTFATSPRFPLRCLANGVWRNKEDPLRVDLQFQGPESLVGAKGQPERVIGLGETAQFQFHNPHVQIEEDSANLVTLDITLQSEPGNDNGQGGGPPRLYAALYASPRLAKPTESNSAKGTFSSEAKKMAISTEVDLDKIRKLGDTEIQRVDKLAGDQRDAIRDFLRLRWVKVDQEERERAVRYVNLEKKYLRRQNGGASQQELDDLQKERDEFPGKDEAKATCQKYELQVAGKIDDLRLSLAEKHNAASAFKLSLEKWCTAMEKFRNDELPQGRLHYRVFMDFKDQPITVAESEGFPVDGSDRR